MKFKGLALKSHRNPPGPTGHWSTRYQDGLRAIEPGKEYLPHNSKRARIRNLRHLCAGIITSKEPLIQLAITNLKSATAEEPEPEFAFLHIAAVALKMSADSGVNWDEAANYLIEKFKERDEEISNDEI